MLLRSFHIQICLALFIIINNVTVHGTPVTKDIQMARPINIAHRGYSGLFPEHSASGYRAAVEAGANYIECDLQFTKDQVAICNHDYFLSGTTDIEDFIEFENRTSAKLNFDEEGFEEDWSIWDFEFDEIEMLRLYQPREGRSKAYDGLYPMVTLEEFIEIAVNESVKMYIELKHPAHYNMLAKRNNYSQTVEEILVQALEDKNIQVDDVLLQSFDPASLLKLFRISEYKLVYLIWEESKLEKLECFSQMFYGIGVWKNLLFTSYNETHIGEPSGLVDLLHSYGYQVHVYTIRNDDLHVTYNQDPYEELDALYNQNIDGYFTDYPESLTKFLDCKYD